MKPFGAGFGRLNRQSLQDVREKKFAALLRFVGALPDAFAGGDDEQRDVIALVRPGIEDVVAQTQSVRRRLSPEAERVKRSRSAWREEENGVAVPFGLEELPDGPDSHESLCDLLGSLDHLKQFDGPGIALAERSLEVTLEPQVPVVEHDGIDVAPDFTSVQ